MSTPAAKIAKARPAQRDASRGREADLFAARDAKNRFGEMLDAAQRAPVTIEKNKRRVAVVVSAVEFDRLTAVEDAYWAAKADRAVKRGLTGKAASKKLLARLIDAER